jgi:hypothetical protein
MKQGEQLSVKILILTICLIVNYIPQKVNCQEFKKHTKILIYLNKGDTIGPFEGSFFRKKTKADSQKHLYYYNARPKSKYTYELICKIPFTQILEISRHEPADEPRSRSFLTFAIHLSDTTIVNTYFRSKDGFKFDNKGQKHHKVIHIKDIIAVDFLNN